MKAIKSLFCLFWEKELTMDFLACMAEESWNHYQFEYNEAYAYFIGMTEGKFLNEKGQQFLTEFLCDVPEWTETQCERFFRLYNSLSTEEDRIIVASLTYIGCDEEALEHILTVLESLIRV